MQQDFLQKEFCANEEIIIKRTPGIYELNLGGENLT